MSIRARTWFVVLLVVVVLATTLLVMGRLVILEGFRRLEFDHARQNLRRCENVLTSTLRQLGDMTADYAVREQTRGVVRAAGDSSMPAQIRASSFVNMHIDYMFLFDQHGTRVVSRRLPGIDTAPIPLLDSLHDRLRAVPGMLPPTGLSRERTGILVVGKTPIMIAAQPILSDSSADGPQGTLVFCRILDSSAVATLASVVDLPLDVRIANGDEPPRTSIRAPDRKRLICSTPVTGLTGGTALVLTYHAERDIYAQGLRTLKLVRGWLVVVIAVFLVVTIYLLERVVLGRLSWLRSAIDVLKRSPDTSSRLAVTGADEVAQVGKDINEMLAALEQACERAERSEQRYGTLFAQMLNGFVLYEMIYDEKGKPTDYRFVDVNPAFERLTNMKRDDVAGKLTREVLPGSKPEWIEQYHSVLTTGHHLYFEAFSKQFGKHLEVMAFRTSSTQFGVTFTDVSERKSAENQREEAHELLSQMRKMEAVGQLAGGIAHDFNNQMAGALGYAVLLKERICTDTRASRYVNNIIVGIRRASDLTAQILAFARKGRYLSVPVDLHTVIHEAMNLLEHSLDKRIKLIRKLEAPRAHTLGDPTQIQNVILNIAINARDAMPEGGKLTIASETVTLSEDLCRRHAGEPSPGRFVCVHISDTGGGIDANTLPRVFEPFFTTKPTGKGIGMGLAAAYGTVRSHGGIITADSTVGHGSTFSFYLPLNENEPVPEGKVSGSNIKKVPGNPHVLVVDDEPIVAEMAADMLTSLGCRVTSVDNGSKAVAYFRDAWKTIDLVLLDMVMPDMTGAEVFRQLRDILPTIRVLISSGYSINDKVEEVLRAGAQGFIPKPFDADELATALLRALDTRGTSRPDSQNTNPDAT